MSQSMTVSWGESTKYDAGEVPAISINNDGVAVEIHLSTGSSGFDHDVWCHVGRVDYNTNKISWGSSDKISSGTNASIALNNLNAVVEVHDGANSNLSDLMYHAGTVDVENKKINWGPHIKYDGGFRPSVAINDSGIVVEMHETNGTDFRLWYRVGQWKGETIDWGSSHKHDTGLSPSIALNNAGLVVEVHQSQNENEIWYRVGAVNIKDKTISWGKSTKYDKGIYPAVGINGSGMVVETHASHNTTSGFPGDEVDYHLWYHFGQVDDQSKTIKFGDSHKYDQGEYPKVDVNDSGITVEAHQSQNRRDVWYHVGKVTF